MEFRLLGPVAAINGGMQLELGRRQERRLLGILLLDAGRAVPGDRLRQLLWGDQPPATARATLHTYVARLRGRLSSHGVVLTTVGEGYAIEVDRLTVDVHRFVHSVAQAPHQPDPAVRSAALQEALDLWRGPLMEDAADDDLRQRLGASLADHRLLAWELQADADLACGREAQVAMRLGELVAAHPTHERLVELLMLAHYRSGRQTEALAAYRALREFLVAELGVEPRPELADLHHRILVNDAALAMPPQAPAVAPRVFLPRDIPDFTGRADDLTALDTFAAERPHATILISGISGVGKTALAVHWAHRHTSFPDGKLYVNLRGYSSRPPAEPADALAQLLRALGATDERIPSDVDEASALYRSVLLHRQALILLDNAASAEQVRPLLPGGEGNLVLVTSRDRLAGLIAMDGARRLILGTLSQTDAVALLRQILGGPRVAADPQAAQELAEFCGHLPLALRIAAANLADHPQQTLADFLAKARMVDRIAALAVDGDPHHTVAAVFEYSFRALGQAEQRLFRLIGLLRGQDFSAEAIAAMADAPDAPATLDNLLQAQLIVEQAPGRYTMHDLLRDYAASLSSTMDDRERLEALDRLAQWCLGGLASTQTVRWEIGPLTYPRTFTSKPEKHAWLDSEVGNIAADLQSFADAGLDEHTWLIAYLLRDHLQLRDRFGEVFAALRIGLASARRLDDRIAQARILSSLGLVHGEYGQYAAGSDCYLAARELFIRNGDEFGAAICDDSLGEMYMHRGDLAAAEKHHRRAHAVPGYLTHPRYGTHAYLQMGTLYTRLGRYPEALQQFQLCLELAERHDLGWLVCLAYHRMALAYIQMGRQDDAVSALRDEIALAVRTVCTDHEAAGWELLGDILLATDRDKAMEAYRYALGLYDRFSTVRADRLRQRLI